MGKIGKLNPPIVDGTIDAQVGEHIVIPFTMNRAVALSEVSAVKMIVKTVSTGVELGQYICDKSSIYFKNNHYIATFLDAGKIMQVGQYYKIQIAYCSTDETPETGFYSAVAIFKYTSMPEVSIKGLSHGTSLNTHSYDYTGFYSNKNDPAEKVYSYEFKIYDASETVIASSGVKIHNTSTDTETDASEDLWSTPYALGENLTHTIQYSVTTINGLVATSPRYRIIDNQTVESNLSKFYDFSATSIPESACIELSINPKQVELNDKRKYINGHFILMRASSEDNFSNWTRMTQFVLASWDTTTKKFLCRDYSVSQGVSYRYALQAFNSKGIYSKRIESDLIEVDFEDMYLSDGKRQLRIRYNPKVSSFKNTLLESKIDTIGGKYPYFFRNGNVKYKEFPISGLISVMMDENGDFIGGMQIIDKSNGKIDDGVYDNPVFLTTDNFRIEREFKNEVLEWLTNGEPKLFRSPAEGSFIIRLMNTSLSPNDTLSRMIHTFSSTAYEVADCSFENLRKYGMMMDERLEVRDLEFAQIKLSSAAEGRWDNLNACMASIVGPPGTQFYYRLQNDVQDKIAVIGITGIYEFDKDLLSENHLMMVRSFTNLPHYWQDSTMTYAIYSEAKMSDFSAISDVKITDTIETWIGQNRDEIAAHVDEKGYRISIGDFYYLKVEERPIRGRVDSDIGSVADTGGGIYKFTLKDGRNFIPSPEVIVYHNGYYYDGRTKRRIGTELDYNLNFTQNNSEAIDMNGQYSTVQTNGRILLTNLKSVTYLYLGNGLYADVVYQKETRTFTVEESGYIALLKKTWQDSNLTADYEIYYAALCEALEDLQEGLVIDAL